MSNPIIEHVTTKLVEQKDKIKIAKLETNLDENEHNIFDARVNKYVTAKLAEQEDNIRIAKLERNLDKKHNIFDIFDVRVQAFIAKENMAKEDEKNKIIVFEAKNEQEDINLNKLFKKLKL